MENSKKVKDGIECYPTGMVVEQGDIAGIVESISELHAHPLSYAACRKRAEKYFDKDKCFEGYIRLYDSISKGQSR